MIVFALEIFGNKHYNDTCKMLPGKSVSGGGIGFRINLHESK